MSEIEKFPRAVLSHHYPDVPLHGDFTTIKGGEYGPIDLLVGGTPCQSFSVAGLRGGMADDRGNLALEFCRLALRARPRWVVWENVPGVLSSWSDDPDSEPEEQEGGSWNVKQRNDFDCFLSGLEECGYGVAYRVLDAQFVRVESHAFAVPQRRRRVFVVGYLGDWRGAAQVLFERESMCGHPPPRRESGQSVTGTISSRTAGGGGLGTDFELQGGLTIGNSRMVAGDVSGEAGDTTQSTTVERPAATPSGSRRGTPGQLFSDPVSHCLNAGGTGRQDWETESFVASVSMASDPIYSRELAQPITCRNGDPEVTNPTNRSKPTTEHCHTPGTGQHPPAVFGFEDRARGDDGRGYGREPHFSPEVGPTVGTVKNPSVAGRGVRRLTPLECERLQGFPDNYTNVTYRNKPAADGPRYTAIGNSMAVNVMSWIGQRIQMVADQTA